MAIVIDRGQRNVLRSFVTGSMKTTAVYELGLIAQARSLDECWLSNSNAAFLLRWDDLTTLLPDEARRFLQRLDGDRKPSCSVRDGGREVQPLNFPDDYFTTIPSGARHPAVVSNVAYMLEAEQRTLRYVCGLQSEAFEPLLVDDRYLTLAGRRTCDATVWDSGGGWPTRGLILSRDGEMVAIICPDTLDDSPQSVAARYEVQRLAQAFRSNAAQHTDGGRT